ncbi:MAG: flagellar motor protein MotD [Acidihalobacter sp.]|uniref:flagellar motor protein MotD n=1 Tax=Acidihalobacter sp. TaxID=1872108 RepID=UPI00307D61F0
MAGKRRKMPEEHINHERWLVSYADFITLLFAFFVVMYAISSVNEGKYRILSESLVAAFRTPPHSLEPIQVGKVEAAGPPADAPLKSFPAPMRLDGLPESMAPKLETPKRAARPAPPDIRKMGATIEKRLSGLISSKIVSVNVHKEWVDIKINTDLLFSSGSIVPAPGAKPVIQDVSQALRSLPVQIQVEGFTDNVPIHSPIFPSNWELSAARAASVVHQMTENGIQPQRLAAVGYGQYHPVASNATPQGRAQNRRVELVVVAENTPLPSKAMPTAFMNPKYSGGG